MSAYQEPTHIRARGLWSLVALCLISGLIAHPATAAAQDAAAKSGLDSVVFANGDKLTGTLVSAAGDSVVFKSDVVGEVTIPIAKVKELRTNGNFVVLKKDETITRTSKQPGPITYADEAITVTNPKGQPETVPTKDLGYVIDQATYNKEVIDNPGFFHRWDGSITGGATVLQSTSYGENFSLGLNLIRAIPSVSYLPARTRTTFNLLETYGKLTQPTVPQTTPPTPDSIAKTNIFHSDFEHDKYLTPRFYMLGDVIYDHNYSQGLNFQQIYGVGAGYTLIKDDVQELDLKADIHYERQNFIQYAPPLISSPNQNLIGSTFAEKYTRALPAKIQLTQGAAYIQSWNVLHAYSAIGSLGLAMPVYHRFSLSVNLLDNYLNNPAFGYQKNSLQFVTGVTYTLH
jgi:hypothetical protein